MGKNKGGSSAGGQVGNIQIPPAISGPNSLGSNVFQPLGTFGSEEMLGLGGLANWAANIASGGNIQTAGTVPFNGLLPGGGTQTFAPFTTTGTTGGTGLNPFTGAGGTGGQSFLSGLNAQQLGPFLANTVQNLINAQGTTETMAGQGANELASGNQMLAQALGKTGLFPSQEAMIQQAVKTQQTQIGQQLAGEGLGNSTLLQSLKGQAALSGAATAGQLVQGNIQLAQTEQQMGSSVEQAVYNQFANIASMSTALQQSMWQEAMTGYGELGNFMNGTLNAFGYSLKTQEDVLQANIAHAGNQVQLAQVNAEAQSAQAQGFSQMLGGLGQLLGTSSGSGGGLLGGLSGLLGGGGGAAGAGLGAAFSGGDIGTLAGALSSIGGGSAAAAGGAGAAAGAGGGLLSGLGGLLGSAGSGIGAGIGSLVGLIAAF